MSPKVCIGGRDVHVGRLLFFLASVCLRVYPGGRLSVKSVGTSYVGRVASWYNLKSSVPVLNSGHFRWLLCSVRLRMFRCHDVL